MSTTLTRITSSRLTRLIASASLAVATALTSTGAVAGATEYTLHSFTIQEGKSGGNMFATGPSSWYPGSMPTLVYAPDGNYYGVSTPTNSQLYGWGNIFRMNPLTGQVTIVHKFTLDDGYAPNSLVLGPDGNLYGTTYYGGGPDRGTLFRFTTSGTLTVLHSFGSGAADGAFPSSNLVLASDGNFYGTTTQGGGSTHCTLRNGCGTVYRVTPAGAVSVIYAFADGATEPNSLMQASDGNLYGTLAGTPPTSGWDSFIYGALFRVTLGGTFTMIHAFSGLDGYAPNSAPIQGGDGFLYGTTVFGGSYIDGNIYRISTTGVGGNLYSFTGNSDGQSPSSGLVFGSTTNAFYGVTAGSPGTMYQITNTGVLTTLYTFTGGADGSVPLTTLIPAGLSHTWPHYYSWYATTSTGGANGWGSIDLMKY
jgi:uncharacterized repeat protein (TIGR03803 family)